MIRKIRREEYLKGYGAMSDGERKDYLKRVGEWLADGGRRLLEATERPMAKAQNIVLLSARWKEQEVTMFAEGVRLLSALMDVADTWLPTQLYAKSAYRATRQIVGVLSEVSGDNPKVFVIEKNPAFLKAPVITEEQKQRIVEKYTKKAMAKMEAKEAAAEGTSKAMQAVAAASIPATKPDYDRKAVKLVPKEECQSMPGLNNHVYIAIPPRPKHIDQYVHLLPEKTQERAKQYGPLKREIEAARENMRLLMNDPHSSAADREKWAKLAARNDEKIAKINAELDREWEKVAATGMVVVDDLGMAHLLPAEGEQTEKQEAAEPAVTQQETQQNSEAAGKSAGTVASEQDRDGIAEQETKQGEALAAGALGEQSETLVTKGTQELAGTVATEPKRKPGQPKKQPEMSDEEKAKRREYLKKWLRDTRTNPNDDRRKQWTKNCKELLALGGEITDSIRKAGEYYGVDLTKIITK